MPGKTADYEGNPLFSALFLFSISPTHGGSRRFKSSIAHHFFQQLSLSQPWRGNRLADPNFIYYQLFYNWSALPRLSSLSSCGYCYNQNVSRDNLRLD